jgi:cobaltochelatase CobN
MHLLATTSGVLDGAAEAVDLNQSPGEIVILSAADSELASLARAADHLGEDDLRLANLLQLQHNMSVDLYVEKTLAHAKLIVLRLLGGASYWRYGLDQVEMLARIKGIVLAILPGDANADPELAARATLAPQQSERLWQYLLAGGARNTENALRYCRHLVDGSDEPPRAEPLPTSGTYRAAPGGGPHAALVFYRSLIEGGLTAPVDALISALAARGIGTTAIFVASLKEPASVATIHDALRNSPPDVILNATSFSAGKHDPLAQYDCPALQVVFAGTSQEQWQASPQGLGPRDLAMNVVLPEIDGRILSRAVSFKADFQWHARTQCRIVTYRIVPDRVNFTADLAANWVKLRRKKPSERNIAIVLANYPDKDGRIANGVGYDTPASTIAILDTLKAEGYAVTAYPSSGNELISLLSSSRRKPGAFVFALAEYRALFAQFPETLRSQIITRWGEPQSDPFFHDGALHLPVIRFGNVAVAIQPARGYSIDPKATYHDPALVPPHGYIAFYLWLRHVFQADAVIHNGKHGNLEWLPGKATSLAPECFPEAVFGPTPQLYPFIVNDPGEGTQAKRRTGAVIVDHLTPPLTRAETYGPLKDLEALVDEYYLAAGLDRLRVAALAKNIIALTKSHRLDIDAGFTGDEAADLMRLDAYLCDLKEAQIRDGLHILGHSPETRLETDLLVALTRVPRGLGEGGDASLIRALAKDFGFGDFDPLTCVMAEHWEGPKPDTLLSLTGDPWRSNGDTVERLELFASSLLSSSRRKPGPFSSPVVEKIESEIAPALRTCGPAELAAVRAGLAGRRIAPGASGAPTRGRLDVLPTGRNFYSLDNRTVPTPTAWKLGQKSAEDLLTHHFQDFGQFPVSLGLSAWGTSNMRTGGDDIAQALALIGAKPVWDPSSWRVTGFEVIPLARLGRPRVDVTLRISGFFRDAFPAQIELLDKAIRTVGALDEEVSDNPIAHRMQSEAEALSAAGIAREDARTLAGHRIFGSKPGAYGAGLQALIDERIWNERADLAAAYVTWGAYAYGASTQGKNDEALFRKRLASIEAVVHNQDNREHDLLDSDDYYQFEGGMSAAVEEASGKRPRVYHNDHSRPERPVIRTLEEEVGRIMRSRVVNPKWITGVKRHGYKGAFEIAATVDYMFAFAATTGAVKPHHFDLAYDAFIADDETRGFIAGNNPAALKEIAERLMEAQQRGLWTPRLNSAYDRLKELAQ